MNTYEYYAGFVIKCGVRNLLLFFFLKKKKNTFESLSKTRLKIEKSLDFEKLIGLQLILIKRKVTIELF